MLPLVSVLLPYRDVGTTVLSALDSVLAQTLQPLEVIAVDDGSSDDGPALVARRAVQDKRILCLSSEGRGIVFALQRALEAARGRFIARMDGDDISMPTRLEQQVAMLEDSARLGAVGVQVEGFPSELLGEGMRRYIAWQNQLVTPAEHARELFVEAPLCHPSVLLRRTALEQVGGWRDVPGPEDYDLWLRLDAAGWCLAKVPRILFRWRHRPGRATFRDGRYAIERFLEVKAPFLAARLKRLQPPLVMWGAGPTGKRTARALEAHGLAPSFFVDVDGKKLGCSARGVPIRSHKALRPGQGTIVAAVGARGARELIRSELLGRGFVEGVHFVFAS